MGLKSTMDYFYVLYFTLYYMYSATNIALGCNNYETIVRFYCMAFPVDNFLYFLMDLKVCSLNVRGLGDKLKRREMFNWLRKKNYSIHVPQEVHCSENTISVWSAEWGYKTLFSCCTSARGGVAILFNNNFNLQLQRSYSDPNGKIRHLRHHSR